MGRRRAARNPTRTHDEALGGGSLCDPPPAWPAGPVPARRARGPQHDDALHASVAGVVEPGDPAPRAARRRRLLALRQLAGRNRGDSTCVRKKPEESQLDKWRPHRDSKTKIHQPRSWRRRTQIIDPPVTAGLLRRDVLPNTSPHSSNFHSILGRVVEESGAGPPPLRRAPVEHRIENDQVSSPRAGVFGRDDRESIQPHVQPTRRKNG